MAGETELTLMESRLLSLLSDVNYGSEVRPPYVFIKTKYPKSLFSPPDDALALMRLRRAKLCLWNAAVEFEGRFLRGLTDEKPIVSL